MAFKGQTFFLGSSVGASLVRPCRVVRGIWQSSWPVGVRRRKLHVTNAERAVENGSNPKSNLPVKVVGVGSSCIDYLAAVASYPKPDDKLRTDRLELQGGGNCANALTATARLGLSPCIVTKIGDDALGDAILAELQRDGVATQFVIRAVGHSSPFTYIIVDKKGGTRTCIHTPGAALGPEELSPALVADILAGAALVYFDGRLTEAALLLATAARQEGIPVLVEAERLRPHLELLLAQADFVVTSAHFPGDWTGEANLGDALLMTLRRLPQVRWMITTLGKRGAVLVERQEVESAPEAALADVLDQLWIDLEVNQRQLSSGGAPDCVSENGVAIRAGAFAESGGAYSLQLTRSEAYSARAADAALESALRAAEANADEDNAEGYLMADASQAVLDMQATQVTARITVAGAASIPQDAVVDTTGAGDAFIECIVYGVATGMRLQDAMKLAAVVAACKCTQLGPRPGLPRREHIAANMLEPAKVVAKATP